MYHTRSCSFSRGIKGKRFKCDASSVGDIKDHGEKEEAEVAHVYKLSFPGLNISYVRFLGVKNSDQKTKLSLTAACDSLLPSPADYSYQLYGS